MICKECGEKLNDSAKFCKKCGWKVESESVTGSDTEKEPAKKKGKTGFIIAIAAIVVVIIGAVVFALSMLGGYRVIKIDDVKGDVSIKRDSDDVDAEEGIRLVDKDKVSTEEDSYLELLADGDKHIIAEENTKFELRSTGNKKEGKIKIEVAYGEMSFAIDNELPAGSKFEVNTPNASLSVRGTEFEVAYDKETGVTNVSVTKGKVWTSNDVYEIVLEKGESATVTETSITGDFDKDNLKLVDEKASAILEQSNTATEELGNYPVAQEYDYDDLATETVTDQPERYTEDFNLVNYNDLTPYEKSEFQFYDTIRSALIIAANDPEVIESQGFMYNSSGWQGVEYISLREFVEGGGPTYKRAVSEIIGMDIDEVATFAPSSAKDKPYGEPYIFCLGMDGRGTNLYIISNDLEIAVGLQNSENYK